MASSTDNLKSMFIGGIEQINNAIASLDKQTQQNAIIASATHDVATQTDNMAKLIVQSANEKEFIGKDSIKAKDTEATNQVAQTTTTKTSSEPKLNKTYAPTTKTTSNNSDNEWESF